jgi:hypothetical protein
MPTNEILAQNLQELADRYLKKIIALGDERAKTAAYAEAFTKVQREVATARATLHALEISAGATPYTSLLGEALRRAEDALTPSGLLADDGVDLTFAEPPTQPIEAVPAVGGGF